MSSRAAKLFSILCLFVIILVGTQLCSADHTIVVFPDSQNEVNGFPSIWQAQNEWVLNNISTRNIVAVLGVGDIVNDVNSTGYTVATTLGYDLFDFYSIPYLPLMGNHDYDAAPSGRSSYIYDSFFGPSRFSGKSWYLGGYPTASNANMAMAIDVSSRRYLVLGLELFPRTEAVAWAQSVIDANPDREVIVVTHAYLTTSGTRYQDDDAYGPAQLGLAQDNSGQRLWDNFIKLNPNIFLVISGHDICSPTNAHLISSGESGRTVNQILSNYQCYPNGGDGYILLLEFKMDTGVIEATPYSTRLDAVDPNAPSFILPYIPSPPAIMSTLAQSTTPYGTTLSTLINDNGAETTVTFDYGLTTNYGSSMAAGKVKADSGNTSVSADIAGLSPGLTYHVRASASNVAGSVYGNDVTFTTPFPQTVVSSLSRSTPATQVTNASTVSWTIVFNGEIIGLSAANFIVNGPTGATVTSVNGTGTTWMVTLNTGSGNGSLGITMANSTGVTDSNGLKVEGLPQSGEVFTIDKTPPIVSAGGNKQAGVVFAQTGFATDDSPMTYLWSMVSGPGNVTFGSPAGLSTTIAADTVGDYILRLTAIDLAGNFSSSDMTLTWEHSDAVPPVVIGTAAYMKLQDALESISTSDTIRAQALDFTEDLVVNRDISIVLDGGYLGNYEDNSGLTRIHGTLIVEKGSISLSQLEILP